MFRERVPLLRFSIIISVPVIFLAVLMPFWRRKEQEGYLAGDALVDMLHNCSHSPFIPVNRPPALKYVPLNPHSSGGVIIDYNPDEIVYDMNATAFSAAQSVLDTFTSERSAVMFNTLSDLIHLSKSDIASFNVLKNIVDHLNMIIFFIITAKFTEIVNYGDCTSLAMNAILGCLKGGHCTHERVIFFSAQPTENTVNNLPHIVPMLFSKWHDPVVCDPWNQYAKAGEPFDSPFYGELLNGKITLLSETIGLLLPPRVYGEIERIFPKLFHVVRQFIFDVTESAMKGEVSAWGECIILNIMTQLQEKGDVSYTRGELATMWVTSSSAGECSVKEGLCVVRPDCKFSNTTLGLSFS